MGGGDLGDRVGQHADVIGSSVRTGLPGPQHARQELGGVVAPHAEWVEPEGLLESGRAWSFSEWAITIVASTSSTTVSPRSVPATLLVGMEPCRSMSWVHTWRRTRARAAAIFFGRTPVTSSSARQTVGGEATGPSTPACWRSTSMSVIASPPSASITATSAGTRPRS